jgi:putative ABC transport system substrate-binding protein
MRRREFIAIVGGTALAWPFSARGQYAAKKIPRIGMLWHAASPEEEALYLAPFRQGLADVGYTEGQNVIIEHRFPAEMPDRMKSMAEELVRLNVDLLVGAGPTASLALQKATRTIPIVFVAAYDPLGIGLVKSYSRPTENLTGISFPDLLGKRLEVLKEALPQLSRAVVLMHTTDASRAHRYIDAVEGDAHKLGLSVEALQISSAADLDTAFASIANDQKTGLAAAPEPMFVTQRKKIGELALLHGLPFISHNEEYVKAGALMSYGAVVPAIFRRAGVYIDKILKGERPGDIPVEDPTKYRLVINLKSAKSLGLTLPPTLLTRADEVIE